MEPLTNLGSAQNSDTIKEASKLLNGLLVCTVFPVLDEIISSSSSFFFLFNFF